MQDLALIFCSVVTTIPLVMSLGLVTFYEKIFIEGVVVAIVY